MEKFKVRPGYQSKELLIEFCGEHRTESFPNVSSLLAAALSAKQEKHPVFSVETMIGNDRYFSYWVYQKGVYEIDDDIWACFISAPNNNVEVIEDIERALIKSGLFEKEDVDHGKYT
jgi:hypothetical protein